MKNGTMTDENYSQKNQREPIMDDLVQIPVPRKYLAKVYAYIGSLSVEEANISSENPGVRTNNDNVHVNWSVETLRKAWDESPEPICKILKLLATHPDEVFTAEQLQEEIGDGALGGTLGAFGRRVRNRYGINELPFQGEWNYGNQRREYKMPSDIAKKMESIIKD